jgi:hypothetical protein
MLSSPLAAPGDIATEGVERSTTEMRALAADVSRFMQEYQSRDLSCA